MWRNIIKLLKHLEWSEEKKWIEQTAVVNLYHYYEQVLCNETLKIIADQEPIKLLVEYIEAKNCVILEAVIDCAFFDLYSDDSQTRYIFKYIQKRDDDRRNNAIEMLEHIGSPQIVEGLIPFFETEKDQFLDKIQTVLSATMHRWKLSYVFSELLTEEDPWIRASIVYAMRYLCLDDFIPILKELSENDPSEIVRGNAYFAYLEITGSPRKELI